MSKSKNTAPSKPITASDVARIQSAVSKQHGGQLPNGSYVGRMQAVVADSTKSTDKK